MVCKRGARVFVRKTAQVTLFIILGILLIVGVSFYVISSQKISLQQNEIEQKQQIPSRFVAVNTYIENCVASVAEDGIVRTGQTGGYIDPRRYGITTNPSEPTDARAVRFDPSNENTATVYWWHFKSANQCTRDCQCASERPNLRKSQGEPSIEGQLSRYINENLAGCIRNFDALKKNGFVIQELAAPSSNVIVQDEDIAVTLNYPLKIVQEGAETTVKQYTAVVPINIRRAYELASKITNTEIKYPFLERWTLEQINAFGLGPDEKALPPTAASVFDPGSKPEHWQKSDAKNLLQFSILPYYTTFLQVWRTSNYDERGGYYQKATVPVNDTYGDLKVTFEYLSWWPIYFDIKGRGVRGNFIGPETGGITGLFSWLGLQRYNFYYDVSYPVRIDIYDPAALSNKGYHFMFNLESNVRDNKIINCSGRELPAVLPPTGTLLCDSRNYCANITIQVSSSQNISFEDAEVSYGNEGEVCDIGRISGRDEGKKGGGKGTTTLALPQCVGAGCSLSVSRYDVFSTPQSLSVRCDVPPNSAVCRAKNVACDKGTVTVNAEGYREKKISVMKKRNVKLTASTASSTASSAWNYDQNPVPLLKNEYALVTLQKVKESNEEQDVFAQAVYYGNESAAVLYPGIVPGKYKVTVDLYYSLPDAAGRTQIVFKDIKISGQNVHIDPMIGTFNEGSVSYDWTLSEYDLDKSNMIVFYGISSPDSSSFDNLDANDVVQIGKSDGIAAQNRASIEPTYR